MFDTKKPIRRVVRILILNNHQKVLLARQAVRQQWHLPGGNLKTSETPIKAARRETKEETGLRCSSFRLVHTEQIEHADEIEEILCYQGVLPQNFALQADGREIDQLKWFSLKKAGTIPLTSTTRVLLQNISIIGLFLY